MMMKAATISISGTWELEELTTFTTMSVTEEARLHYFPLSHTFFPRADTEADNPRNTDFSSLFQLTFFQSPGNIHIQDVLLFF